MRQRLSRLESMRISGHYQDETRSTDREIPERIESGRGERGRRSGNPLPQPINNFSIASNWGVRCDNSQRASVTEDSDQLRQYPFKDKRSGSILS